ncbi:hypothetical protein OROHE_003247 [Orobanche hederae]
MLASNSQTSKNSPASSSSMAAKPHKNGSEMKKRKSVSIQKHEGTTISNSKKPKLTSNPKKLNSNSSNIQSQFAKKPFKSPEIDQERPNLKTDKVDDSKKLGRLRAKELTEARKKKRKKHYSLEQELALLWEKMRRRNIPKEDRSRLVSEALKKMKGKISEIASSHVLSRVLQTCVKHCTQDERNDVFKETQPHFIALASNTYAVHLITKLLDHAPKELLTEFISSLHGHVASLLRHMGGSLVIEHAYHLGNATQKQALLMELYSPELKLFKDLVTGKDKRIEDVISKLQLQKSSVLRHMTSVLQPVLEKGILDHSIVHKALMEYFSIANQDRKKIIKGMKTHVDKIAHDKFGSMVLVCIFSVVDDTKLVSKIIIRELEGNLKELLLDHCIPQLLSILQIIVVKGAPQVRRENPSLPLKTKGANVGEARPLNGRRPFLQLLHPNCTQYFSPDDLTSLTLSIPSLKNMIEPDGSEAVGEDTKGGDGNADSNIQLNEGGKKCSLMRRQELLVNSGLAEKLVDACCEISEDLLRSKYGKDVIYEVATGGADGILHPTLDGKLGELHEAIASIAAQPKLDEPEQEHILENFHSSRIIRKLVLDCPVFASTLWEKALKGNCAIWAKGHSLKVINAFVETSDSAMKDLAKEELQPLIEKGDLSFTCKPMSRQEDD